MMRKMVDLPLKRFLSNEESKTENGFVIIDNVDAISDIFDDVNEIKNSALIKGNNIEILKKFPSSSIDIIYMDPPFFTRSKQKLRDRKNGKLLSFDDIWKSNDEYLQWIKVRLTELKRILKKTGSIYLHCDWHASHLLRVLLDEIFYPSNFRGEIIWTYKRWTNSFRSFQRSHEIIYFYSKSDNYKFNVLYDDYSFTTNIDQIWQTRARDENNKVITPKVDGKYIPLQRDRLGVPMRDVWEIPYLNPKAKERTGYPTQKPVELILRIIDSCRGKNSVVLDPFCGSGTTLEAARIRHLRWIGIDDNNDAIRISKTRLTKKIESIEPTKHHIEYRLATFLKLPRNEKIHHIAELLDMNIAHRNRYIDGFLKKTGAWKNIAVRYIENESLKEAIDSFVNASIDRGVDLGIIILPRIDTREIEAIQQNHLKKLQIRTLSYEELVKNATNIEAFLNESPRKTGKNRKGISRSS